MKRTRQHDRDMPGPQTPWDEIVPGLWMGGHYWTDPAGELQPVVVTGEFDLVVSLFTRSGLVVAQALVHLGHDPAAAIRLVRRKRSPWALNNTTFTNDLATGLDVAYLLTGLQE